MAVPTSSYLLENLRFLFERKEALNFVKHLESYSSLLGQFSDEQQEEVAMMAAFVYFELKNYKLAAFWSLKVCENLQRGNLVKDAHELFREMSIIGLKSYLEVGRAFYAYFFINKMIKAGLRIDSELKADLNILTSKIAGAITRFLDYLLPIACVFSVVLERITRILPQVHYIVLLVVLFIVSMLYYVFETYFFKNCSPRYPSNQNESKLSDECYSAYGLVSEERISK